ncbi:hypothetical protein NS263_04030 [Curtobacterium oceanosedimentum]|uniref:Transposase n=1 Tax=Curtobacterium oceanosedimentum TaxID=465820 RepID=A0ABR5SA13_9MICO|nr:hypothetical protein [Curtobacterium oceanosedimentum]KTR41653.1 hypothetical protein NS263_04030 [Curtobacterium oceanosedimentum]
MSAGRIERVVSDADEGLTRTATLDRLRYGIGWLTADGRLPTTASAARPLSGRRAITLAIKIIDRSGIDRRVLWWDERRSGPKRHVTLRTMLILLIAYQVQRPDRDMVFLDVAKWALWELSAQDRVRAGLTHERWNYYKLVGAFHGFVELIDDEDSPHRIHQSGVIRERIAELSSRDRILNALIAASIPDACPATKVAAMDSTDIETAAALHAQLARPDGDDEYVPEHAKEEKKWGVPISQLLKGADGRFILSADIDARCGYRTVVNGNRSTNFVGWDAHVLVDAGWYGALYYVQFIRGMVLRPAGSHKGDAGIALLDSIDDRFAVDTLCSDRGYSYAVPERWARPLLHRGITWVHDLHPNQRTQRGLMKHKMFKHVVIVDGTLFTNALPENLRSLPAYHPGMSAAERRELTAKYDARANYAFVPNGNPKPDGKWQYRGPAYLGHVDCPNVEPHRAIQKGAPPTNCVEGGGCWCDKTPTLEPDEHLGIRQKYIYGTSKWLALYGMRNASEAKMADLKRNFGTLRRASSTVTGTTANAVLFAIRCIAINTALRHSAYGDEVTLASTDVRTVPVGRRRHSQRPTPAHRQKGPKSRPQRKSGYVPSQQEATR